MRRGCVNRLRDSLGVPSEELLAQPHSTGAGAESSSSFIHVSTAVSSSARVRSYRRLACISKAPR
jgi:hypothetical protein